MARGKSEVYRGALDWIRSTGCADLDGLRTTVPYVLHACAAVSVFGIGKRAGERCRFIGQIPSRPALFMRLPY